MAANRLTIQIADEGLQAAVQREAARRQRTPDEVVAEIIDEWLEFQDEPALIAAAEEARREWVARGGEEAEEFFRTLAAEQGEADAAPR